MCVRADNFRNKNARTITNNYISITAKLQPLSTLASLSNRESLCWCSVDFVVPSLNDSVVQSMPTEDNRMISNSQANLMALGKCQSIALKLNLEILTPVTLRHMTGSGVFLQCSLVRRLPRLLLLYLKLGSTRESLDLNWSKFTF